MRNLEFLEDYRTAAVEARDRSIFCKLRDRLGERQKNRYRKKEQDPKPTTSMSISDESNLTAPRTDTF